MPRRKAGDGAPAAPKAPRSRRKKVNPEESKPPDAYDPMMGNGYGMDGMESGMYQHHHDYGYNTYAAPPPFGSPEPSNSPYVMPQPPNNSSQNMMMRPIPPQNSTPTPLGPGPNALEFRIHDMNRRLYIFSSTGVSESDHQQWWDAFSHEFFDDECKLWFIFSNGDAPEKYCISRGTIPRFFRSIFDSGTKELTYVLRGQSRECQTSNGGPAYENDNVLQVTKYDNPHHVEIHTESKLYIEFTPYDEMMNHRIKAWTFEFRQAQEFNFRGTNRDHNHEQATAETNGMTRMGFFNHTIRLMTLAKVLEPMQILMGTAKANNGFHSPSDLLRRTLYSQFMNKNKDQAIRQQQQMNSHHMMMQPQAEPEKPKPVRKRTRKPAANPRNKKAAAAAANGAPTSVPVPNPSSANPQFQPNPMGSSFTPMPYQDVMVVGEPSMMGGDFGEEDERTISRVENAQYDPSALHMQQLGQNPQQQMGNGRNMQMGPPMGPPSSHGMPSQMNQPMPPSHIPSSMPNQMAPPPNQMHAHSQMHMAGPMSNPMGGNMMNHAPNSMGNHHVPHSMPNQMPPMQNHLQNPMQNPMGAGMPPPMPMQNQMPGGMPSQMPPQMNSMPQGYNYQSSQQWQQPPANPTMITS